MPTTLRIHSPRELPEGGGRLAIFCRAFAPVGVATDIEVRGEWEGQRFVVKAARAHLVDLGWDRWHRLERDGRLRS